MYYGMNSWKVRFHTVVEVTHIFVYAKDVYSFNDKADVSQYLGHWNRHGVIVAYDVHVAEKLKLKMEDDPKSYLPPIPPNLDKPVDVGNGLKEKEIFYPVRNRDFRSWRQLKGRGGDFLIFSDLEVIKLPVPIIIDLGESYKDYVQ